MDYISVIQYIISLFSTCCNGVFLKSFLFVLCSQETRSGEFCGRCGLHWGCGPLVHGPPLPRPAEPRRHRARNGRGIGLREPLYTAGAPLGGKGMLSNTRGSLWIKAIGSNSFHVYMEGVRAYQLLLSIGYQGKGGIICRSLTRYHVQGSVVLPATY